MVSLLMRRQLMGAKKDVRRPPAEYQLIEYAESTTTTLNGSCIDTGILARNTQAVVTFAAGSVGSSTNNSLVGAYNASNQRYYAVFKPGSNYFAFIDRSNSQQWRTSYNTNKHTIIFNDESHGSWFDGVLRVTSSNFACTGGSNTIYLFGNHGFTSGRSVGKIYSAKFINNTTGDLLGDFAPCYVKATEQVGMYDFVTEEFFAPTGSIALSAGPTI